MNHYNNHTWPIPPRWLNCPRKGTVICGKFLPFKTPLDSRYDDQIPEENRFDLDMLFMSLKCQKLKMGLIVDLTNTKRFYDSNAVESKYGCKYFKLFCSGREETPDPDQTNAFVRACEKFIQNNPLEVIGTHCTHGFNRTGFLIVAYLVEVLSFNVDAAVRLFATARPPGIYKPDYLRELWKRYGDEEAAFGLHAPLRPEWCLEDDANALDDDGNRATDDEPSTSSGGSRKRKREIVKVASFMDGQVPSVTQVSDEFKFTRIQEKIQRLCGWKESGFPGGQPVSMDCQNIHFLLEKKYRVSWKADGVRYMMLIDGPNQVYMVDRDNAVFQVPGLSFPKRKDHSAHLMDTLLDGEMIRDKIPNSEEVVLRYLVYDIVSFNGTDVGKMEFRIRHDYITHEIIKARHDKMAKGLLDKTVEPFSVRAKPFYDLLQTRDLLEGKFAQQVSHEIDGIIFQPTNDPYVAGRSIEMLKWKPPSLNSVDFKLQIKEEKKPGMLKETLGYLYVGGKREPFAMIKVTKQLKELNSKIVECCWDAAENSWKFHRERLDKSFPNGLATANGVCNSIRDPVTKEKLYEFITRKKSQDDALQSMQQASHVGHTSFNAPHASASSYTTAFSHSDKSLMPPPAKKMDLKT